MILSHTCRLRAGLLIAIVTLGLDQWSKLLILSKFTLDEHATISVMPFFQPCAWCAESRHQISVCSPRKTSR